jgi:hypothetical protein
MRTTLVMMTMAAVLAACETSELAAQPMHPSIPCPVLLVSGRVGRDSIDLSFMNRGKMPIQQLSLDCSPPTAGRARDAICHTESGLFYPGQRYSIMFGYTAKPGSAHGAVTLSVKEARLGNGELWIARNARACRPLKVFRRIRSK